MTSGLSHESQQARPASELLARYRAILTASWAMRHELAGPGHLADEAAFLPAALSLQETPTHPAPLRLAWTLIALFLIAVAWAIFGKVDIVAVAPGRIIVSERTKVVQPLQNSVVTRILVHDGQHVKIGQPLVELDPTEARADKISLQEVRKNARSEALRSRTLLQALSDNPSAGAPRLPAKEIPDDWNENDAQAAQYQLTTQWQDIRAQLSRLAAETQQRQAEVVTARAFITKLQTTLPIVQKREQDFLQLAGQGFVSSHSVQDKTRERIELERDLATQRAEFQQAQAALYESEQARHAYLAETRRTLNERQIQAELQIRQTTQELAKAIQREYLATLIAPVDGTVQQLAAHTEGGVVTEAQTLMVIVPESASLTAEVALENKDIGFVYPGQQAAIKLETFPYTRYGTLNATVEKITQDAIQDEKKGAIFMVTLRLHQTRMDIDGKTIHLSPGMNLTAEIKTGKRRIIEFITSPIQRATTESLRER